MNDNLPARLRLLALRRRRYDVADEVADLTDDAAAELERILDERDRLIRVVADKVQTADDLLILMGALDPETLEQLGMRSANAA